MTAPFQTTHFWKIVETWQHELLLFSTIWFSLVRSMIWSSTGFGC